MAPQSANAKNLSENVEFDSEYWLVVIAHNNQPLDSSSNTVRVITHLSCESYFYHFILCSVMYDIMYICMYVWHLCASVTKQIRLVLGTSQRAVALRLGSTDTMVCVWVAGKNCVIPLLHTGRV